MISKTEISFLVNRNSVVYMCTSTYLPMYVYMKSALTKKTNLLKNYIYIYTY